MNHLVYLIMTQKLIIYNEFEVASNEGGLKEFAECFVKEIQFYLHFDYKFGETWYWRNYFYDSYKKQKMLNRNH